MTKLQNILKDINSLEINDLELVMQEILKKIDQEKGMRSILEKYKGIGKGVWNEDAGEYVRKLRKED